MSLSSFDLDETLDRARQLDAGALAQIHDRYYPEVYRYVRYRLESEAVCEDITSEVFLRLLDALHRRRGPSYNLRGWLLGCASNLVNDHLRHHYKRPVDALNDGHERDLVDPSSPEASWEDRWQQQRVHQALRQLTSEQQHVLALRFGDERSLEETAQITGKTVTAIKALQFRALASLKRLLSDERA